MMQEYKIGDFLKRVKKPLEIEDSKIYKRITIKTNHKGVCLRNESIGAEIGTKKQFTINGGDFILSKIDARYGAFGIIPSELDEAIITGNFWTYEVDKELVDTEWFFYFTHSYDFLKICEESSTGTTHRKYLNEKIFLNHPILLPEKSLQSQMVEVYKNGATKVNILSSEIQTQKSLLIQLKQSILQEAIQGKLTAEWRAQNPELVSGSHSAATLLENIKAEKARLVKEKKIKKEKPLPPIEKEEIPFDLPEGWVWCRLGEICHNVTAGSTPSKDSFVGGEIPYLKVYNIRNQKVDFDYKSQFIKKEVHQTSLKRCILRPGDVIMNIVGPPLGKVAMIPSDFPEWNCNQAISIFRGINNEVNPFIYKYLCAGLYLNYLHYKGMAGQDNISVTMCKELMMGLPPLAEQRVIVNKVEVLMEKSAALEQEITQSEQHAQTLMQAVLKEAFEGEKVNKQEEEMV